MTKTNEDFHKEDVRRLAGEAKMLLGHPMLSQAFDDVEESTVYAIKKLRWGPEESEVQRDKLMLTLQVVEQVKESLQHYIDEAIIMNHNEKELDNGS
jgi:hypothetical protein